MQSKKRKFLNGILTTASALAVITGASNAWGAAVDTTGANTFFSKAGAGATNGTTSADAAAFADGSNINFAVDGTHVTATTAGVLVVGAPATFVAGNGSTRTFVVGHDVNHTAANLNIKLSLSAGTFDLTGKNALEAVTISGGIFNAAGLAGVGAAGNLTMTGGTATLTAGVSNNVDIGGNAVADITGAIGGTVNIAGASQLAGHAGTDVAGVVTINSTAVAQSEIHNATAAGANAVTVTAGDLKVNQVTAGSVKVDGGAFTATNGITDAAAGDLTVNGGAATITAGGVGHDLIMTGGTATVTAGGVGHNVTVGKGGGAAAGVATITAGNIGGTLDVLGAGRIAALASNVAGTVTINTTNAGVNTISNATGGVTLTAGKLTMNDSSKAVSVAAGVLNIHALTSAGANGALTMTGGEATVAAGVGGSLALSNAAKANVTGPIGGDVTVSNTSQATVAAVTGNVTINDTATVAASGAITGNVTVAVGGTFSLAAGGSVAGATTLAGVRNITVPNGVDIGAYENDGGTLIFAGTSTAGVIGAANPLAEVRLTGGGGQIVTFGGQVSANTLNLAATRIAQLNAGAVINTLDVGDATSRVKIANNRILEFTGKNAAIDIIVATIVFDGDDSEMKFNAKAGARVVVTLDAALDPGAAGKGIIILNSEGVLLAPPNTDSQLTINGGSLGNALNTLKKISVTGDKLVIVNSAIVSALLEVTDGAKLRATDKSAGSSTLTNIKGTGYLEYKPGDNMDIKDTTFAAAASTLALNADGGARTFTLKQNIDPGGNGKGIVVLGGGGSTVTLEGDGGVKTLGTGGNHIAELQVIGDGTGNERTSVITANVDVTDVNKLTVFRNAILNSKTKTTFAIPTIKIGEAPALPLDAGGGATLIVDSMGAAAIAVLNGGKTISFEHTDSVLKLTNIVDVGGNDTTFTLHANLAPGAATDLQGSLQIDAGGTKNITIAQSAAETIGTDNAHRLKNLTVSGSKNVTIAPAVFAKNISITNTGTTVFNRAIDTGAGSVIEFTGNGTTTFAANVNTGKLKFNAGNRALTINAATVTAAALEGNPSALTFVGAGTLNLTAGTLTVPLIIAPAAVTTKLTGSYATEIQLAANNSEVQLDDGFNLTGGFNTTGGAAGIVKFLGSATVSDAFGIDTSQVGVVTVAGNNKTLELRGSAKFTSLDGVAGGGADVQTLKFANTNDAVIKGNIGGTRKFEFIEFAGTASKKVDFQGVLTTDGKELKFTTVTEVITTGYNLGATKITATAPASSILKVNVDQTITGSIADFGTLDVSGDRTVNINTVKFGAALTTAAAGNGTVTLSQTVTDGIKSIGDVGARFKITNFNANNSVGDIHADTIAIAAGRAATFGGSIDTNQITFADPASTANFGTQTLAAPLIATAPSNGIANFDGTTINAAVGTSAARLAEANFKSGKTGIIGADIHANAINVDGEVSLAKKVTFDGASTFKNKVALGGNDLTLINGAAGFKDGAAITTTVAATDLGNLVVGTGSTFTNETLNITVDSASLRPVNGRTVTLIQKKDGGKLNLTLDKINVTTVGALDKWVKGIDKDGNLILRDDSQVADTIAADIRNLGLSDVVPDNTAQAIEDAEAGSQGERFSIVLQGLLNPDGSRNGAAVADAVVRATTTTNEAAVGLNTLTIATGEIGARLISFVSPTPQTAIPVATNDLQISGIAAGDEDARHGAWATPFYSKNIQKKKGSAAGYNSDGYGGTFGFDTKVNDQTIAGLALTLMDTKIKHKDFKSGDRTTVNTLLFSAYANYQFDNNWFGQGVFSVGSSNVTNKENRRISVTSFGIAEGKYSSMTFAADVLGGYNHLVNNQMVVTPTLGFGYSRINDGSYQETGNVGPQLLYVTKKASQKLDLIGGLRLTGLPFMAGEVAITPEIHGSVRYDVLGQGTRVSIKLPGINLPSTKSKQQRTYYNIGTSVKATYGMMDYGVAVDGTFADKYAGVNGSINLRVNF